MAHVSYWQQRFVEEYIVESKRERYLSFLKGRKHRQKILEKLNHSLDYDESKATRLDASYRSEDSLIALLRSRYVAETCFFMADQNRFDGHELRLDRAVPELLENFWGASIICPPQGQILAGLPIAVYKEEDVGDLFLLSG